MAAAIRRIGVLTGGGDCPGLNAAIRAVVKSAMFEHGLEVCGIEDGFLGLIENRIRTFGRDDVSNILTLGGTVLGTSNKANPSKFAVGWDESGDPVFKDVTDDCMRHLEQHKLDALVVIGGDGTMACAAPFVERGVNCVGVPKTIDNDVYGCDVTIGFDTAVEIAAHALDRLHTTASSHHRTMIAEVMGRNAGWIALYAGVASGADVICIPEIPYDLGAICDFVRARSEHGKRFSLICVAEGAHKAGGQQSVSRIDPTSPEPIRLGGVGEQLADDIERCTGIESRAVVFGHVQRGGTPTSGDRVLATALAHRAVQLITEGRMGRLVVTQNGTITDVGLLDAAGKQRKIPADNEVLHAARAVGTCFGEVG
jgi:6-phosphofructokinase 1